MLAVRSPDQIKCWRKYLNASQLESMTLRTLNFCVFFDDLIERIDRFVVQKACRAADQTVSFIILSFLYGLNVLRLEVSNMAYLMLG